MDKVNETAVSFRRIKKANLAKTLASALILLGSTSFANAACIDASGDIDSFTYETVANDRVTIAVLGQTYGLDPIVEVYNPSGTLVASNDDGATSGYGIFAVRTGFLDSLITNFTPTVAGVHSIKVRGFGTSAGCYLLVIRDEAPNTFSAQGAVRPNASGVDGGVYELHADDSKALQ